MVALEPHPRTLEKEQPGREDLVVSVRSEMLPETGEHRGSGRDRSAGFPVPKKLGGIG